MQWLVLVGVLTILGTAGCLQGQTGTSPDPDIGTDAQAPSPAFSIEIDGVAHPFSACGSQNTDSQWFETISLRLINDDEELRGSSQYSLRGYLTNGIALSPCEGPNHDIAPMAIVQVDVTFRVPGDYDEFEHGDGPYISDVALFYGSKEIDRANVPRGDERDEDEEAASRSAPDISFSKDSADRTLTVVQAEDATWDVFIVTPSQCKALTGTVGAGDIVDCRGIPTPFTVRIVHRPTDSLVYETTFS